MILLFLFFLFLLSFSDNLKKFSEEAESKFTFFRSDVQLRRGDQERRNLLLISFIELKSQHNAIDVKFWEAGDNQEYKEHFIKTLSHTGCVLQAYKHRISRQLSYF